MTWFEHATSQIYFEEDGSGDPVLILPGFAGSISSLSGLRDALTAAGYRVIAADLPGSGRSLPQPRFYTAAYYEEDAESFAALLRHLATGPAHLLGFSDGGEVELLMAALTPDVARSVVTWGAAGAIHDPEGHLRAAMAEVVDHPIPPLQGFSTYLRITYGEENARAMTRSVVAAFDEIIAAGGEIGLAKAASISCPTLLIAGEHDFLASPPLVATLAARIRGAEVKEAKGAGHDVFADRPDWLIQTVLAWLGEHGGQPIPAGEVAEKPV